MQHLKRTRGDTKRLLFQLLSDTTGEPVGITGYTFLLTVDPTSAPTDNTANVFQLTGVIDSPASGTFHFTPTAGDVDLLGPYYYDVQATDANSELETVSKGRITFSQDITK